ncbi:hypothetical protein IT403_00400 [Candidatus Nomurabacteria bacterium]|nr:hypothetical protein [Candidatus Nomurabacteria bacterium]
MNDTEKIDFEEMFDSLPLETQSAIVDVDIPIKVQEAGLKFGLHVDQMGALFDATQEVALGIANYDSFANVIESKLAISRDMARQITSEMNQTVFKAIREKMIEMSNFDNESENKETDEEKEIDPEETSILEKTGIDLSFSIPQKQDSLKDMDLNRDSMLSGLENPPRSAPIILNPTTTTPPNSTTTTKDGAIHPLQQKIQSSSMSQSTETNHSLKVDQKISIDPYREMPL